MCSFRKNRGGIHRICHSSFHDRGNWYAYIPRQFYGSHPQRHQYFSVEKETICFHSHCCTNCGEMVYERTVGSPQDPSTNQFLSLCESIRFCRYQFRIDTNLNMFPIGVCSLDFIKSKNSQEETKATSTAEKDFPQIMKISNSFIAKSIITTLSCLTVAAWAPTSSSSSSFSEVSPVRRRVVARSDEFWAMPKLVREPSALEMKR